MSNTNQSYQIPQTGFIRLPDVLKVVPISKSTWWAGIQSGRFPKGIKITPRTTAWRVEDIRELVEKLGHKEGL